MNDFRKTQEWTWLTSFRIIELVSTCFFWLLSASRTRSAILIFASCNSWFPHISWCSSVLSTTQTSVVDAKLFTVTRSPPCWFLPLTLNTLPIISDDVSRAWWKKWHELPGHCSSLLTGIGGMPIDSPWQAFNYDDSLSLSFHTDADHVLSKSTLRGYVCPLKRPRNELRWKKNIIGCSVFACLRPGSSQELET